MAVYYVEERVDNTVVNTAQRFSLHFIICLLKPTVYSKCWSCWTLHQNTPVLQPCVNWEFKYISIHFFPLYNHCRHLLLFTHFWALSMLYFPSNVQLLLAFYIWSIHVLKELMWRPHFPSKKSHHQPLKYIQILYIFTVQLIFISTLHLLGQSPIHHVRAPCLLNVV